MKFLLYTNVTYPEAVRYAEVLQNRLTGDGHTVIRYDGSAAPVDAEMLLVLGGDGTVIRAVRDLYAAHLPVWAVNLGHLGYLTECDVGDAEPAIRQILSGDYDIQERILLTGRIEDVEHAEDFFCLNDTVIHRSGYTRMLRMELSIDGKSIMRFSGDGILISTPTGSTAYNLSAGGPILLPDSDQLVVTPICPHAAVCPPIVVPAGRSVSVRVNYAQTPDDDALPQLSRDGLERCLLQPGAVITCGTAAHRVAFVKTNHDSFYERLRQKMAGQ